MPLEHDVLQSDQGSLDEAVLGQDTGGADAGLGEGFDLDGERYTPEQLREAIEAQKDRDAWEAAFKQRDMRFAGVRKAIENGFGKQLSQFDDTDLRDLHAFGLINAKMRAEPEFAKAWQSSLVEAYKQAGMPTGQAKAQAARDVKAAEDGQGQPKADLPPEVMQRLQRVDTIENMIVQQGLAQFQTTLEGDIKDVIGATAKDLGKFHPMIRNMVLQGIAGYTDVELLERYQSGQLKQELTQLARQSAKTVRGWTSDKQTEVGDKVRAGKSGAAPGPARGGTAERVVEEVPKPGRGLRSMADRLLKEFTSPKE